jgi:hypothetical protein
VKFHSLTLAVAAAALLSAPVARAQQASAPTVRAGPTIAAASIAFTARQPGADHDAAIAAPRRSGLSRPAKLMIFGGAALLTGVLIGNDAGTVIAVGGAVVGLYGLYLYLSQPGTMQPSSLGVGYRAPLR